MLSIGQLEKKGLFIVHTLFIWLMYLMMFWAVTFALPETNDLSFSAIIPAFVAGGFAMTATNGGIGLYPIAVAAVLQAFAVSYPQALAFGWLMWTAQTVMVVIFGSISFFITPCFVQKIMVSFALWQKSKKLFLYQLWRTARPMARAMQFL